MTINEKIKFIRKNKGMSQAELAFKIDCSIKEINDIETNGTTINGFLLLQILTVFNISIDDFKNLDF